MAGGEEAAAQKTTEKKDEKKVHKTNDADALIAFMKKHYDDKVKGVETFDEFYHAIYELIE
jgi:rhamnogalacturonan II specific xylosyltransferase